MLKTINVAASAIQTIIGLVSTVIEDGASEYNSWSSARKEIQETVNMRKVDMLLEKIQEVEAIKYEDDTAKQAVLSKLRDALKAELKGAEAK